MATTTFHLSSFSNQHRSRPLSHRPLPTLARCSAKTSATTPKAHSSSVDPSPLFRSVTSFGPATVANLGPCFDFLGCAVDGLGDHVTASVDPLVPPGSISISSITGTTKLSHDPLWNCAGISASEVMRFLCVRSVGVSLRLRKGLPLGSGLGSSAASAAAAAVAVNALFGSPLTHPDLVLACLASEAKVSGYHADNVAPAIMGGFVLVGGYDPLDLLRLNYPFEKDLFFVLARPEFEAPTKKMRAALPAEVPMKDHIRNSSQAAAVVAAVVRGDARALGAAMSSDVIVEPRRAPLIPGMAAVRRAAIEAGAYGCTISGAGPTAVAVVDGKEKGKEVGVRMVESFLEEGKLKATVTVTRLDQVGARVVEKK